MKRFLLVSSDCHAGASWEGYRPFMDRDYLDRYEVWVADKISGESGDRAWRRGHFSKEFQDRYNTGADPKIGRPSDIGWDTGLDSDERRRLLEEDGIVAEVLFPDNTRRNAVPFRRRRDLGGQIDLLMAGTRAYNRWLASYCAESPNRRVGIAVVPLVNIPNALEEIRWAKQAGMPGIMVSTAPQSEGVPGYDSAYYEPIWTLCEKLGVAVHTHAGGNGSGGRILAELIWSGVLERHPALRCVWTEQGVDWIPPLLTDMDTIYAQAVTGARLRGQLPLKPSEYWARNCWGGHSTRHIRADWDLRATLGVRHMMWGSDFPHPEGTWPYTREALQVFAGVPESEARAMLGETAAEFYGLDVEALAPVVERFGPAADAFELQRAKLETVEAAFKGMYAKVR